MTLRMVRPIAALALGASLASCTIQAYNSVDPASLIDWDAVMAQARREGALERKALLERAHYGTLPQDDPLTRKVTATFKDVAYTREVLALSGGSGFFRDDAFSRASSANSSQVPSIQLLATDEPLAITYADGAIVIARGLIETLGSAQVTNKWAIEFVAAHELVHHYDGHAIFHWIATKGHNQVPGRRFLSSVTSITRHIPLLNLSYDYAPSEEYRNAALHESALEFVADYWAYYVLKERGAPAGATAATLVALRDAEMAARKPAPAAARPPLVAARSQCMRLLDGSARLDSTIRAVSMSGVVVLATREGLSAALYGQKTHQLVEFGPAGPTRGVTWDDAYWSCAWQAIARERSRRIDPAVDAVFSSNDAATIATALSALGVRTKPAPVSLVYPLELDGIPMTAAATAFASPRVDMRPNLVVKNASYKGWADGLHHVQFQVRNVGHNAVTTPVRMGLVRNGSPVEASACPAGTPPATGAACTPVLLGPDDAWSDRDLYFAGPAVPIPTERTVEIVVDDCDARDPKGTDAANRCAVDESNEKDNGSKVVAALLPNLVGYMRAGSGPASLGFYNRGFAPTSAPFRIVGLRHGNVVALTRCPPDAPQTDECGQAWVRETIAPGAELRVTLWEPGGSSMSELRFWIDGCERDSNAKSYPVCAIEELDEGDNVYN